WGVGVGRVASRTERGGRWAMAVVRPTQAGQPGRLGGMSANTVTDLSGCTSTMVVPVPWLLVLLLKLSTRMSPAASDPTARVTVSTAYGFTSPLAGVVEANMGPVGWPYRKDPGFGASVEAADCSSGDRAAELEAIPAGAGGSWGFDPQPAAPTTVAVTANSPSTRAAPANLRTFAPLH